MKIIVFTWPGPVPGEGCLLDSFLDAGAFSVHLRKPGLSEDGYRRILDGMRPDSLGRVVLHEHFGLCGEYGIGMVRLNDAHPLVPEGFSGGVCRSCHSLDEVRRFRKECTYVTLSPIFDSISKEGYLCAFPPGSLVPEVLGADVVALGGVTRDNLPLVAQAGFGGAAFLGWIRGRYLECGAAGAAREVELLTRMTL